MDGAKKDFAGSKQQLTAENAMPYAHHTPGQGRRRSVKAKGIRFGNYRIYQKNRRKNRSECPGLGTVQFFEACITDFVFRFELKYPGGLFGTPFFFRIPFFAARRLGGYGLFCTTTARICDREYLFKPFRMGLTGIISVKKRDGGFSQAITINLMNAHAHGSTEKCRHPKPNERFMDAGSHF